MPKRKEISMIDKKILELTFKRIKNTVQYRNKTDAEIWEIAKDRMIENDPDLDYKKYFKSKVEKRRAKELLKKYLHDYIIETISDKNALMQLVYLEIVDERLRKLMTDIDNENDAVPAKTLRMVHENLSAISEAKKRLGILRDMNKDEKDKGFKALNILKKKFENWREEHQGSRTLNCPHCGKFTLLKIRMDIWEAQKHPFFKDRIIYNKGLARLYKNGRITRKEFAEVLEVSEDYIDWVLEKVKDGEPESGKAVG